MLANTVASLHEIVESSPNATQYFEMKLATFKKLVTPRNECTEWAQIFILDLLASYSPWEEKEVQSRCERVPPRLSHANAEFVLSAVKVLMILMEMILKSNQFVVESTLMDICFFLK